MAHNNKGSVVLPSKFPCIFMLALGLAIPVNSVYAETTNQRITDLEDALEELRIEMDEAKQESDRVSWDLYVLLEYENFDNTLSEFDAKNIEFLVNAQLTDRLHLRGEIEFEGAATTEPGPREGAIEVEQAWIQYDINQYFNPRFGAIVVPFSKFNAEHFDPLQDLTDRPIMARRIVPTTWSEAGVGFVGRAGMTNYEVFIINGFSDEISDKGMRSARGPFRSDNNQNKAIAAHIELEINDNLQIGFSGYVGKYSNEGTTDSGITGMGLDLDYTIGDLEILADYAKFDLDSGLVPDGAGGTWEAPESMNGFYVQANYHFWPKSLNDSFLGRGFSNPTFTAVVRYGEANIDDDGDGAGFGAEADNEEKRITYGINYRPVETVAIKFEYQVNETTSESLERGNNDGFIMSVTGVF